MASSESTRRTRWRGLALSLLLSLLFLAGAAPAPARAALDLNAAVATAKNVFPSVTQRCGGVGIEVGPLVLLGASAESYVSSCRVRIAPATMTTATNAQLCSLMVHEWGHLAGLEHSPDPNNFMSERVPHNPVCGPSDEELRARQALEGSKALRRDAISGRLSRLRGALRATRKAQRRAHGAKRARLARRAKGLERRMNRLRAELRSL